MFSGSQVCYNFQSFILVYLKRLVNKTHHHYTVLFLMKNIMFPFIKIFGSMFIPMSHLRIYLFLKQTVKYYLLFLIPWKTNEQKVLQEIKHHLAGLESDPGAALPLFSPPSGREDFSNHWEEAFLFACFAAALNINRVSRQRGHTIFCVSDSHRHAKPGNSVCSRWGADSFLNPCFPEAGIMYQRNFHVLE